LPRTCRAARISTFSQSFPHTSNPTEHTYANFFIAHARIVLPIPLTHVESPMEHGCDSSAQERESGRGTPRRTIQARLGFTLRQATAGGRRAPKTPFVRFELVQLRPGRSRLRRGGPPSGISGDSPSRCHSILRCSNGLQVGRARARRTNPRS
jgi:hypothetical protein